MYAKQSCNRPLKNGVAAGGNADHRINNRHYLPRVLESHRMNVLPHGNALPYSSGDVSTVRALVGANTVTSRMTSPVVPSEQSLQRISRRSLMMMGIMAGVSHVNGESTPIPDANEQDSLIRIGASVVVFFASGALDFVMRTYVKPNEEFVFNNKVLKSAEEWRLSRKWPVWETQLRLAVKSIKDAMVVGLAGTLIALGDRTLDLRDSGAVYILFLHVLDCLSNLNAFFKKECPYFPLMVASAPSNVYISLELELDNVSARLDQAIQAIPDMPLSNHTDLVNDATTIIQCIYTGNMDGIERQLRSGTHFVRGINDIVNNSLSISLYRTQFGNYFRTLELFLFSMGQIVVAIIMQLWVDDGQKGFPLDGGELSKNNSGNLIATAVVGVGLMGIFAYMSHMLRWATRSQHPYFAINQKRQLLLNQLYHNIDQYVRQQVLPRVSSQQGPPTTPLGGMNYPVIYSQELLRDLNELHQRRWVEYHESLSHMAASMPSSPQQAVGVYTPVMRPRAASLPEATMPLSPSDGATFGRHNRPLKLPSAASQTQASMSSLPANRGRRHNGASQRRASVPLLPSDSARRHNAASQTKASRNSVAKHATSSPNHASPNHVIDMSFDLSETDPVYLTTQPSINQFVVQYSQRRTGPK